MAKTIKILPAKSVSDYLDPLTETKRAMLEELRQTIKAAAPEAEEIISYRIPTYKYLGPLVHFAAFENHCSLIVVSKSIIDIFKNELQSYNTSGTTIHFTPKNPLPASLVKKIIKTRIQENEENEAARKLLSRGENRFSKKRQIDGG